MRIRRKPRVIYFNLKSVEFRADHCTFTRTLVESSHRVSQRLQSTLLSPSRDNAMTSPSISDSNDDALLLELLDVRAALSILHTFLCKVHTIFYLQFSTYPGAQPWRRRCLTRSLIPLHVHGGSIASFNTWATYRPRSLPVATSPRPIDSRPHPPCHCDAPSESPAIAAVYKYI